MTSQATRAHRPSFDPETIGGEIDRLRDARGYSVIEAADLLEINRTLWYKKAAGKGSRFWPAEIDRLAEVWDAPTYWPYVPYQMAEMFEAWRRGREATPMIARYAVLIDKPVAGVAYGPIVMAGTETLGHAIAYFEDPEAAKLFTESAREWDRRQNLCLGRLRVFDQVALAVLLESTD